MDNDTNYLTFIEQCLVETSNIASRQFGRASHITTKTGDNNQVLTDTDLEIGTHIIKQITKIYPDHNIIDEEAGVIDNSSEYTWVIDPIDGTSNFASGVPLYGTIIGLLQGAISIAGGIALPYFNEIILAQKGQGAFCNGKKIQVTQETRLLSTLIAYGIDGHQEDPEKTHEECRTLGNIILGIRNLRAGGSVFDMAMVAKGNYGGYLNRTSKIWDNVGQHIIIEEAGGIYTDFFGKPVDYTNPLAKSTENYTWCTGAPSIYKQLQDIIHS